MRRTEYGNTTTLRIEMDLPGLFQKTKKRKKEYSPMLSLSIKRLMISQDSYLVIYKNI